MYKIIIITAYVFVVEEQKKELELQILYSYKAKFH
jgi:hypothetical protein